MDPLLHKLYALFLLSMLGLSAANLIEPNCGPCERPPKKPHVPPVKPPVKLPPIKPPVELPPIKPPVELPPIKPPVELPPIKPPIELPPVTLPPIKPPVTLPPVTLPPVTVPPVTKPPAKPCPTPAPPATCPIDTLKLGACVDLLGGLVHIGLGDPVVNECCPVLSGLVELEAAVCLCTTLKVKLLNLSIYVPLALQLLVTCGKTPPPGYTCTI
ncbi:hypothetical protein MLD38_014424 [Melastoma candidum]|uniref:Uncharacterized protein n=1 Tax=Melastoma candidum TaxID=119954 RepID=A0ACB9RDW4_9MYRT|nr:hypothetical protein MLD38_014424 [Melastoma candidum]